MILVREDSTLKQVADLKGRKVALQKGSSAHNLVLRALNKAGLNFKDIQPVYLSPADVRWNAQAHSLLWGGLSVGVDASAALRPVFGASVPRWVAADVLSQKVPVSALRDKTVVVGAFERSDDYAWSIVRGRMIAQDPVLLDVFALDPAIETDLPVEYRELVGRYFQVIAKEAGKGK